MRDQDARALGQGEALLKKRGYVFKKKTYRVPRSKLCDRYTLLFVRVADRAFQQSRGAKTIVLHPGIEKIGRFAFKKSSFKTIVLQTRKLTQKSRVKKCLSGSKVGKVKVSVGSKKKNRSFQKKYKKVFKKKVVGRKVAVRR